MTKNNKLPVIAIPTVLVGLIIAAFVFFAKMNTNITVNKTANEEVHPIVRKNDIELREVKIDVSYIKRDLTKVLAKQEEQTSMQETILDRQDQILQELRSQ